MKIERMKIRPRRPMWTTQEQSALEAWNAQVSTAEAPALRRTLRAREHELLPKFAAQYERLRALPRRVRRTLARKVAVSLAGAALLLGLGHDPALAATISVDGTTCTLADAITAANSDSAAGGCPAGSGADTIALLNSVVLTSPLPIIGSTLTIEGNGQTVERSASASDFGIFVVSGAGALTLNDTTVTGGSVPNSGFSNGGGGIYNNSGTVTVTDSTISGNTAASGNGGGIHNAYGTLTVEDSTISGNTADQNGGGIYNNVGSTVTITRSTISGNTATRGGGIYGAFESTVTITDSDLKGNSAGSAAGAIWGDESTVTISGSTLSGNTAGQEGGAIALDADSLLTMTNSTVSGNTAGEVGGGVSLKGSSVHTITGSTISGNTADQNGGGIYSREQLTVTNSTISGNVALGGEEEEGFGGGIFNRDQLTVTSSTILGNRAVGLHGGGIHNDSGTVEVDGSTVSGNTAGLDGGGLSGDGMSNVTTITNSTISGNTAGRNGGGLSDDGVSNVTTITNSTLSGNTAQGQGGGIAVVGYLSVGGTLTHVTVTGNAAKDGGGIAGGGTLVASLVSGNTVTGTGREIFGSVNAGALNIFGHDGDAGGAAPGPSDIVPTEPLSGVLNPVLRNNRGSTETHALATDSPAIDAITAGCPPPATDQRGFARPQGDGCDIGAVEQFLVSGITTKMICRNLETRQTVIVEDGLSFDDPGMVTVTQQCAAAGLEASPGDRVDVILKGEVE